MEATIKSIAIGKSKTYDKGDNQFQSGYKKDQFFNFVEVDELGINGDMQVDKRYHGGIDKAIHIGSLKHFENFAMDKLAMGCNILIENYDENDICVGDIYTIGDIEVQVTQPRQPCWKIGALFGKEVSRYIVKNYATGWYVKVLQGGTLDINDPMILKERTSDISIKQLSVYLHIPPIEQEIIDKVLSIEPLAQAYKNDFLKQINKNKKD